MEAILDAWICFTYQYDMDKVIKIYPWFNRRNYIYSILFPEREDDISIIWYK